MQSFYDRVEGQPDQKLVAQWTEEKRQRAAADSDYDSDEDPEGDIQNRLDTNKLEQIKTLMFNTHRVKTGEDKLHIPSLMQALQELSSGSQDKTFSQVLFNE